MRVTSNVDTDLISILELRNELDTVFDELANRYRYIKDPSTIGIALRCLPESVGRKSFRRYDKKDQYLTIDITVSLEKYSKLSKTEQRHQLGVTIFTHLKETLTKYKFSELSGEPFLMDFKNLCDNIGWLKDEIDWARYPD